MFLRRSVDLRTSVTLQSDEFGSSSVSFSRGLAFQALFTANYFTLTHVGNGADTCFFLLASFSVQR